MLIGVNLWLAVALYTPSAMESIQIEQCDITAGFLPGKEVYSCDLFDYDANFLEAIVIEEDERFQWHCTLGVEYIRCIDATGHAVWPEKSTAMCPFTGSMPSCPEALGGAAEPMVVVLPSQ
ncbi:MAG: hypothetical protein WCW16_04230 [Candidatus Magasanikbacteria bacterium]